MNSIVETESIDSWLNRTFGVKDSKEKNDAKEIVSILIEANEELPKTNSYAEIFMMASYLFGDKTY